MTLTGEKAVPVLYLDLDGTVRRAGGRIIGVSNQGGIALGHLTEEDCVGAMVRTYELTRGLFDKISYCRHHPDAADPEMARCWCRKPSPGLVIEAALDVASHHPGEIYPPYMGLFVGDRPEDEECARLAGLDFQWAADWRAQAAEVTSA